MVLCRKLEIGIVLQNFLVRKSKLNQNQFGTADKETTGLIILRMQVPELLNVTMNLLEVYK